MSTSQKKPQSFKTIGQALAPLKLTGMQPSATGSVVPQESTLPPGRTRYTLDDPKDELLPLLRPIVTASTARLISTIRFAEKPIDAEAIPEALELLHDFQTKLDQLERSAQPAKILSLLEGVASAFQVELPTPTGLQLYVAALADFPIRILEQAAVEVLKSHRFKTMPLPGEFLDTEACKAWPRSRQWARDFLDREIPRLLARHPAAPTA